MIKEVHNRKEILKNYILNQLFFDESEELEEEFLENEELAKERDVVEFNLINDYVLDRLSPEDEKLFKENFLITNENFEKVKSISHFHQNLKIIADNPMVPVTPPPNSNNKVWSIFDSPRKSLAFATFATLFIICSVTLFVVIKSVFEIRDDWISLISENNVPEISNSKDEIPDNDPIKSPQPSETISPITNNTKKEYPIIKNTKKPNAKTPLKTKDNINSKKKVNGKSSHHINSNKNINRDTSNESNTTDIVPDTGGNTRNSNTSTSKIPKYKAYIGKNTKFLRFSHVYGGDETKLDSRVIAKIKKSKRLISKKNCQIKDTGSEITIYWIISEKEMSDGIYEITYEYKHKGKYEELFPPKKFNFKKIYMKNASSKRERKK